MGTATGPLGPATDADADTVWLLVLAEAPSKVVVEMALCAMLPEPVTANPSEVPESLYG